MRKVLALTGLAGALIAGSIGATTVAAAPLVDRFHAKFNQTFEGQICGIPGTISVRGVENFQAFADGTFAAQLQQTVRFTSTTNKTLILFVANRFVGQGPIDNGDGTVTFISTFKGLPEKLKLPHGRTLTRDAGIVSFIDTFTVDGEFLGEEIVTRGPHPEIESGFTLFCDVIIPALS